MRLSIFAAVALAAAALSVDADARRVRQNDAQYPVHDRHQPTTPGWVDQRPEALPRRSARPYREHAPRGNLVAIKSRNGKVAYVAARYAPQFQAFIRDFEAAGGIIKFMGGWRARGTIPNSLHPRGMAIDVCQYGRSIVDRRCNYPTNATAIAARHGLLHGAVWRNADKGHFEVKRFVAYPVVKVAAKPVPPAMQLASAAPADEPLHETTPLEPTKALRQAWPRTLPPNVIAHSEFDSARPYIPRPADIGAAILKRAAVDDYLCEVYNRTKIKRDNTGDFTWKDIFAAIRMKMDLCQYVIGGMAKGFKDKLSAVGQIADAQGIRWSILSGFRDDYRQKIAAGIKARVGWSLHGGSQRVGGYGNGRAVDVTSVDGDSIRAANFFAKHGPKFGLFRPYPGFDPAHIQDRVRSIRPRTQYAKRKHHHRRQYARAYG